MDEWIDGFKKFERNERKFCLLNEMSGCPKGDFSAKLRKIF